jgi:hypothetical protein
MVRMTVLAKTLVRNRVNTPVTQMKYLMNCS